MRPLPVFYERRNENMKTYLLVADSKVINMVARNILEQLCLAAEEAEDCQVVMGKSMESMPGAILLDWNMPVMSGI